MRSDETSRLDKGLGKGLRGLTGSFAWHSQEISISGCGEKGCTLGTYNYRSGLTKRHLILVKTIHRAEAFFVQAHQHAVRVPVYRVKNKVILSHVLLVVLQKLPTHLACGTKRIPAWVRTGLFHSKRKHAGHPCS